MRQGTYRLQSDGTPDTIAYMEDYLDQFHTMKDIFLEFRVTKRTQAKVDRQRKEIRQQRSLRREGAAPSQRHRICDDDRDEENELRMDMINAESHFNFVKMHLLSHFCDHIRQFGNTPMYSTEIGELAHKTQIKEGWRQSNKNDAAPDRAQLRSSTCHPDETIELGISARSRRRSLRQRPEAFRLDNQHGIAAGHLSKDPEGTSV